MNDNMISDNIGADERGFLTFAGISADRLAAQYGTPLYLIDENRVIERCREYLDAFNLNFGQAGGLPCYACKANCFSGLLKLIDGLGLGIDVVSTGEFYTAMNAGFPVDKILFHGNAKTDRDLEFALKNGVGRIVVDNSEELEAISRISRLIEKKDKTKILIRVTPGIDPHTYEAVNTGMVDSKFGSAIETGAAFEITEAALNTKEVILDGFHCHVGSQVLDEDVHQRAAEVMINFIADVKERLGFEAKTLDIGGGIGIRYVESDTHVTIKEAVGKIASVLKKTASERKIKLPFIIMEPGRSIVADAGMTLYTVSSVKKIPGYRNYVAVDGGMTDNPRYALYKSKYTCYPASDMISDRDMECTVAGCCCESGDIIQTDVPLPSEIRRGDLIAVSCTGAYNYSMSSNYNRIPRPPVIMIKDEKSRVAVSRESTDDIISHDVIE